MDKKKVLFIIILLLSFIVISILCLSNGIKVKNVDNVNFKVSYDSTWKLSNNDNSILLVHKKSKATLDIKCKVIDSTYIDTSLSELIDDIIYSIHEQNSDYKLINREENVSDKYDSYSYLYEKEDYQVLVNVYKKDSKIVIAYYEANSDYFDIVLDSVDSVLDSLEILVGEK